MRIYIAVYPRLLTLSALLLPAGGGMIAGCGDAMSGDAEGGGGGAGGGGMYYEYDEGAGSPANEGDSFEAVGTNPFIVAAHDPFSTFAADVDTASYDIFRRDLGYGYLPRPESVRLEEYVNYFSYDYPAPQEGDEHPFSISLAGMPHVFDRPTTLLRIGIQGRLPPPAEKKPANLVFLIDTSGSMTSVDKLPLVKEVLTHTLTILDDDDTVSIVTYAGSTEVRLSPTPVARSGDIIDVIQSLESGGSTAGASGIELAYAQAALGFIDDGINHVILCTDGDFNVGISDTESLVALIEAKRATGITLTVLGFGTGNLNDAMMEAVSNAGNGIYAVITTSSHAQSYVEERMLSTLVHIAKDMKIQVELNPDHVYAYRLLGYENRAIADEDFRDDAVDAGEIGAGHRVTALYELVLGPGGVPIAEAAPSTIDGDPVDGLREVEPGDLVLVKVRYKDPGATAQDPAYETSASLAPAELATTVDGADADTSYAAAVAAFAEILKESPFADPGALDLIESILQAQAGRDADRQELAGLFAQARALLAAGP